MRIPVISRNRGFGLVEIMVGLVVGLVTMIVIMQVGSVFEGQKRAITSGGDAQTNGAIALYMMEREVRTAGNGMTESVPQQYPLLAGCTTRVFDTSSFLAPNNTPANPSTVVTGGTTADIRLAPVVATDGGGTGNSDSLTLIYGSSAITAPYFLSVPFTPATDTTIGLTSAAGIASGDMIALVDRDLTKSPMGTGSGTYYIAPTTCSLMQVSGPITTTGVVPVAAGRYNKGGGNGLPLYSQSQTVLYNLGRLNVVTYRISKNPTTGEINLVADISQFGVIPNGTATPTPVVNRTDLTPIASNIVNMQVQYGVDTANPMGATQTSCKTHSPGVSLTSAEADGVVDAWVDPAAGTQWANNGTTTPTVFDLQRIRAVRIGLVARSGVKERPNSAGACDTTTTMPVIHWDSGPDMKPDLLPNDNDWQCYRYKVFQTTIPVRNALWSSTMNPASAASCGLRDPA